MITLTALCIIAAVLIAATIPLGIIGRVKRSSKARGRVDPSLRAQPTNAAATLSVVANKLRVTLGLPMVQIGLPHYAASGGAHSGTAYPTAITQISPAVFDLTYAANVAAGNTIVIPQFDAALRTFDGGYVLPKTQVL